MVGKIALAAVTLSVGTATAKTQREAEIAVGKTIGKDNFGGVRVFRSVTAK